MKHILTLLFVCLLATSCTKAPDPSNDGKQRDCLVACYEKEILISLRNYANIDSVTVGVFKAGSGFTGGSPQSTYTWYNINGTSKLPARINMNGNDYRVIVNGQDTFLITDVIGTRKESEMRPCGMGCTYSAESVTINGVVVTPAYRDQQYNEIVLK